MRDKLPAGSGQPFVVVSSPEMHAMAENVVKKVNAKNGSHLPHYRVEFQKFSNGEIVPRIPETVRRQHVFFFHAMQFPDPNEAIVSMLLMNDALRRASVAGITLVTPYMPYLRQDRKDKPRAPISARMLADVIESNKSIERVITADMHADQAQGFFSIPVDNLSCMRVFAEHALRKFGSAKDTVIVSPDFGGAVRARRFAEQMGDLPVAIFEKRRPRANESEIVSLVGEPIKGKRVILCDDMIDTGGTIRGVMKALTKEGAREVHVFATHAILSGGAEEKFAADGLSVCCTDSIPRDAEYEKRHAKWLTLISIESLLADAVYEASLVGGSVSKLSH